MPLPLAVMIPFMAGQSFAMGEAFGKGFQYGKRRISAMTNEEFNAMSASDHFTETTADISAMIPSMKSQMNNFSTLQTDIIKTLIDQLKDAGITIGEAVGTIATDTFTEGPPAGTDLAQQSLDTLRSYVGLPPLYAKLVDPKGLNALLVFWKNSNLINALKIALNPTVWLANEIKKIFTTAPSGSTVNDVYDYMVNLNFIGPPAPDPIPEPIPEPAPNTLILDDAGNVIDSGDTRVDELNRHEATTSIETDWKKLTEEIRISAELMKSNAPPGQEHWKSVLIQAGNKRRLLELAWWSPSSLWK